MTSLDYKNLIVVVVVVAVVQVQVLVLVLVLVVRHFDFSNLSLFS